MAQVSPRASRRSSSPRAPGERLRVAVPLVEELCPRAGRSCLRRFLVAGHVGRKSPAVHPDHRLEPGPRDDDAALRRTPPATRRCARRRCRPACRRGRRRSRRGGSSQASVVRYPADALRARRPLDARPRGDVPEPRLVRRNAARRCSRPRTRGVTRMEREPVAFFARDLEPALDDAREELAEVPGCRPGRPRLRHERHHGRQHRRAAACASSPATRSSYRPRLQRRAQHAPGCGRARRRQGVVAAVSLPGATPRWRATRSSRPSRPRTRLVMVDHVTSPTALVLPGGRDRGRARRAWDRHARRRRTCPGHGGPRPRRRSAPRTTVGNCHKWMCAPKGARVPPRPSGSPGAACGRSSSATGRTSHANRSKPVPARARLDRHARSYAVAERAGGHRIRRRASFPVAGRRSANADTAWRLAARDLLAEAIGEPWAAPDEMVGAMVSVPLPLNPPSRARRGRTTIPCTPLCSEPESRSRSRRGHSSRTGSRGGGSSASAARHTSGSTTSSALAAAVPAALVAA